MFSDRQLAENQQSARASNHLPSAKSKSGPRGSPACNADVDVGSLVFIKHEGSKFQAREMYIIVAIKKGYSAILQKMDNGKIMSTQYEVPLSKLLPCQKHSSKRKVVAPSDLSMDSDISSDTTDESGSESDSSIDEFSLPEAVSENNPMPSSSSRPVRNRRQPERYGDGYYNLSQPLPGENDITGNWGPGWSKEAWASDCHAQSEG